MQNLQGIDALNLENIAFCSIHQESRYCYINLQTNKETFICNQCAYKLRDADEKVDFSRIVDLLLAYQAPEVIMSKLTDNKDNKKWINSIFEQSDQEIKNQFQQQIQQLEQLKMNIDAWIQQLKDQNKQVLQKRKDLKWNIAKIVQFPKFQELVAQLATGRNLSIDAYKHIEMELQIYFKELTKDNCSILQANFSKLIGEYNVKFTQIPIFEANQFRLQFDGFQQYYEQFQKSIIKSFLPFSNNLLPSFKLVLLKEISSKLNKEMKQSYRIYSSNEEGLNFEAMWRKIQEKKQLLFVFRSGNGAIFGAFTPCKWQKKQEHALDQQMASFLFSQNKQEIFPLKESNKKWAQLFDGNILCFGGTWKSDEDLILYQNFQNGFSKLGRSYYAEYLDGSKTSEILFQGQQPNIKELEIFEIQ